MTTRLTSRIPPAWVWRLRAGWSVLAVYLFVTWLPRMLSRFTALQQDSLVVEHMIPAMLGLYERPLANPELALISRIVEVFTFMAFAVVALILYRRRSDDWLALFTGMLLLLTAYGYTGSRLSEPPWGYLSFWMLALMETCQVTFFYIFPNGRFVPTWAKWGVVPLFIFRFLIWENIYRNNLPQGALEVAVVVVLLLIGVGLQVYRYRRHASPVERQQVKWLLVGFTATILFVAPSVYILSVFTDTAPAITVPVVILRTLALLLVPISIGISVTRYRLWDLDLTLNRSLVGAVVTAFLAAVFAGVFFAAQASIQAVFGPQSSAFAAAAGAAVVGALFLPAKRRVRHFVDRRLYDFRFDLNELRDAQKLPEVKKPGALTGQTIGAYQILDVLGRGGMGEVYKGFGAGKTVAVKIMPPEIAKETKNARRFEREIDALQALDHPNVVRLLDAGVHDDQRYMVMDYIDGIDLTHYIRDHGALAPETAHGIARDIGEALAYIHQRGQVHRDVTSGNIMVETGETPRAVLMDFGLVKILARPTDITMSGDVMGTIDYMAPEQIIQTQTVDYRSDIYALGAVYYELVTGKRPFSGGPAQVLFAHLYQPPPDPRAVRPELPKPLAAAIMRAMAKSPDERFQSVADFIAAAAVPAAETAVAA